MGKKSLTLSDSPHYRSPRPSTTVLLGTAGSGPPRPRLRKATRLASVIALCWFVANSFTPGSAWAQGLQRSPVENAALGITSFLATIPYGATKLLYAGLGAMVGSFSYVLTLGNTETAEEIWEKSLLGTYVLSPEQLTGEEPIRFVGP